METTAFLSGNHHADRNLALLDPDVRKAFRSERAINDAFRLVSELRKVGSLQAKRSGFECRVRSYGSDDSGAEWNSGLRRRSGVDIVLEAQQDFVLSAYIERDVNFTSIPQFKFQPLHWDSIRDKKQNQTRWSN